MVRSDRLCVAVKKMPQNRQKWGVRPHSSSSNYPPVQQQHCTYLDYFQHSFFATGKFMATVLLGISISMQKGHTNTAAGLVIVSMFTCKLHVNKINIVFIMLNIQLWSSQMKVTATLL